MPTTLTQPVIPNSGFFSLLAFVVELLLATSIFVFKLKRRRRFWLWLPLSLVGIFLFAYLWDLIPEYDNGTGNIFLSIIYFILTYLGIVGTIFVCFKLSLPSAFFLGTAGYAMQHFTYKLIQIIIGSIEFNDVHFRENLWGIGLIYASVVILSLPFFYFLFARNIKKDDTFNIKDSRLLFVSIILMSCTVVLNLIFERFINAQTNLVVFIIGCLFDMVCCFFSLFIEFEMLKNKKISEAYIQMKSIWESEKRQLEISKENMDYIRVLAHDLKHELNESNLPVSSDKVKELKGRISTFGNALKTGNDILDLVLAERALKMQRESINLSLIADGTILSFMRQSDCYSLFMNILDNAIDAVNELPPNQREISLSVRQSMGMALIHEVNPYKGKIEFKNGLPVTTKKDHHLHGLGTKSIKIIVENYSGECVISTKDDNVFVLDILLPIVKRYADITESDED